MSKFISVSIHLDGAETLQSEMNLLANLAERSTEVRQRLLDLGNLSGHFRCVDADRPAAAPVHEIRIRLEYSDALGNLVAAARAGDFDEL